MKKLILASMAAILLASCGSASSASGPTWLRPIHDAGNSVGGVGKFCDTETGNLVYLYGDFRGGIAVVPGGCK